MYFRKHFKVNRQFRFKQIDVFTKVPFNGNPVAVVFNADHLDNKEMQKIASWTNLSETSFILTPTTSKANYLLKIFTPCKELTFAGHPSIGSAFAILESGLVEPSTSRLVQECGVGLLDLKVYSHGSHREILVRTPDAKIFSVEEHILKQIGNALRIKLAASISPLIIDIGPRWLVINIQSKYAVQYLTPSSEAVRCLSKELQITGIVVFGFTGKPKVPLYVRTFAPAYGIPEDPVCGSGNASVATYLAKENLLKTIGYRYVANQGLELGRNGFVSVEINPDDHSIYIGGYAVTCVDGYLLI